jgi:hypothetical protein
VTRCLPPPNYAVTIYSDATCTTGMRAGIAVAQQEDCAPRLPAYAGYEIATTGSGTCALPSAYSIYPTTDVALSGPEYEMVGSSCTATSTTAYQLGAEIPPAMFGAVTSGHDP